jgi:hypothetical protein
MRFDELGVERIRIGKTGLVAQLRHAHISLPQARA